MGMILLLIVAMALAILIAKKHPFLMGAQFGAAGIALVHRITELMV